LLEGWIISTSNFECDNYNGCSPLIVGDHFDAIFVDEFGVLSSSHRVTRTSNMAIVHTLWIVMVRASNKWFKTKSNLRPQHLTVSK
jgi:hypothetical protein